MKITNYPVRNIKDLRDMLQQSAKLYGDHAAFLWKNGTPDYRPITTRQYQEEVEALGAALWDMGYAGKRIVVTGENGYPWALSYMTVVCGLGVVVPVDKEINKEEMENIINISEASLILHGSSVAGKLADLQIDKICFEALPALVEKGKQLLAEGKQDYLTRKLCVL